MSLLESLCKVPLDLSSNFESNVFDTSKNHPISCLRFQVAFNATGHVRVIFSREKKSSSERYLKFMGCSYKTRIQICEMGLCIF